MTLSTPPTLGLEETHPLDNPAYAALNGPHAPLAERRGNAVRYPVDVSPFGAVPAKATRSDWEDLGALARPDGIVVSAGVPLEAPEGWEVVQRIAGVQMVDETVDAAPDDALIPLSKADVGEMLALVARTQPGPFLLRTIELGTYLGIRRGGALVAMAGERLHPPGWTEISAVCTADEYRQRGFASRLVRAVAHNIRQRGEQAFLHTSATNSTAIRLYEQLGFRLRRAAVFQITRVPTEPDTG